MIDLKILKPEIIKVNNDILHNDITNIMSTIGKTVIFQNKEDGIKCLKNSGFEQNSKKLKERYFYKIIDKLILIVHLNKIWIDEKYWIPLNKKNIDFCQSGFKGDFFEIFGDGYDTVISDHNKPFYESFRDRRSLEKPTAEYRFKTDNGQVYRIYQNSRSDIYSVWPWFLEDNVNFFFQHMHFNKDGNLIDGIFYKIKKEDPYFIDSNLDLFNSPEYKLTMSNFHKYFENFDEKKLKKFWKLVKGYE